MKKRAELYSSKKAQFYIIAAIVIIVLVVSLATIRNYIYVKKEPVKFYDMTDILEMESLQIIDNSNYGEGNVNKNVETYLTLFADYLDKNTKEDFNLIILYGNATGTEINGIVFSRASLGGISASIGGTGFFVSGGTSINSTSIRGKITLSGDKKKVNVTLTSETGLFVSHEVPLLEDNNFVFIMTTSDGFNQYVKTNLFE